jgi:hypothetical protein
MWLTKLFPPRKSLVSDIRAGKGMSLTFFTVYILKKSEINLMRFSLFNNYFGYAGGDVPVHDDEELAHRAARPSGLCHQEHRRHYRHAPVQLNP